MEKEKKEKYMANFKVSKAAVKVWEGKYVAEHGRRPGRCHASPFTCHMSRDHPSHEHPSPVTLHPLRDDIRVAPDKIQLCYKNMAKIKAFFDEEERRRQLRKAKEGMKEEQRREEEQGKEEEPSFAGVLTSTVKEVLVDTACRDISNITPPSSISSSIPPSTSLSATLPSTGAWGSHLNHREGQARKTHAPQTSFERLSSKLALQVRGNLSN